MFKRAALFNQPLSHLDVSRVAIFDGMFEKATAFNQALAGWDTARAASFHSMFAEAAAFNQHLDAWVTTSLTNNGIYVSSRPPHTSTRDTPPFGVHRSSRPDRATEPDFLSVMPPTFFSGHVRPRDGLQRPSGQLGRLARDELRRAQRVLRTHHPSRRRPHASLTLSPAARMCAVHVLSSFRLQPAYQCVDHLCCDEHGGERTRSRARRPSPLPHVSHVHAHVRMPICADVASVCAPRSTCLSLRVPSTNRSTIGTCRASHACT